MKRKRGHKKKGKSKKQKQASQSPAIETAATIDAESPDNDDVESDEDSGSEDGSDNVEEESKATTAATPVKVVEEPPQVRRENVRPDWGFVRPTPTAVYGRVKVKLKTTPKPPSEPQVAAAPIDTDAGKTGGVGVGVVSVADKKQDGVVGGDKVEDGGKKTAGIKIVSSSPKESGASEKSGGIRIVSSKDSSVKEGGTNDKGEDSHSSKKSGGIKIVSSKDSSPTYAKETGGTEMVQDSSKKSGGIKIVSSKNSTSSDGKESGGSEMVEDTSKKSGGIKIVSSKNLSPSDGKESGGSEVVEDSSKKSGGIKIVSSKNLSPSDGKESGGSEVVEDSSKKSSGIKIVSSKNLSPSDGKESGSSEKGEDSSKKPGGIKIVSSKNLSPSNGKESSSSEMVEDSSKKSSGIKIVSSKNSSPSGGKESGSSDKGEESSKKSGGIKIVSSKNSSPSGGRESGSSGLSPEEKKKTEENEVRLPQSQAKYNKQELEASLEVIMKIMKMDAAEPFNVPVDPIKLGIPDYFDVIDTPMDFGTVRSNLESGTKYMDSEDVYKDVQYIWDNCYKYNNKGDYIVDLMKRVKKNFMKYWMAAGLYTEQSKTYKDDESSPLDEPTTSGYGKKLKKGKGVKRHKDDCLCAICIMKRRRREREAREAQAARELGFQVASPQIKVPKIGMREEYKQEEVLHPESPVEYTSSYMETSPDGYAEVEMEDADMRPEAVAHEYNNEQKSEAELHDKFERSGDMSEKSVQSDKGDTELHSTIEARVPDESGSRLKIDAHQQLLLPTEVQTAEYLQQRNELLELEKKRQKLRMLETFRDLENPMLLGLCGTLFPNHSQSVWSRANSLVKCKRSCHRGDIHEAVASFMNPPCKPASSSK